MIVKFKKLHPDAVAPLRASEGAGGFDLLAVSLQRDEATNLWIYGTGLAVEVPAGHVGLLFPRSSVHKTGMVLSNSVGVIDSDYRGEIKVNMLEVTFEGTPYKAGHRVGQLVIAPIPNVQYVEVDELSDTARGDGGFGSTGQ